MKNAKPLAIVALLSYIAIIGLPQRVSIKLFFSLLIVWTVVLVLNKLKKSPLNKLFLFYWLITAAVCIIYTIIWVA